MTCRHENSKHKYFEIKVGFEVEIDNFHTCVSQTTLIQMKHIDIEEKNAIKQDTRLKKILQSTHHPSIIITRNDPRHAHKDDLQDSNA